MAIPPHIVLPTRHTLRTNHDHPFVPYEPIVEQRPLQLPIPTSKTSDSDREYEIVKEEELVNLNHEKTASANTIAVGF
ncbi:hypothetical protein E2P81_ATG00601 [Venturia nashicola]|nr:hypothetical protein E2P81_ATG00601 [Venturia nashicola]